VIRLVTTIAVVAACICGPSATAQQKAPSATENMNSISPDADPSFEVETIRTTDPSDLEYWISCGRPADMDRKHDD